jgi:hypothetical protein
MCEAAQRILTICVIEQVERTPERLPGNLRLARARERDDAFVNKLFNVEASVVIDVRMHKESRRVFHIPLRFELVFACRKHRTEIWIVGQLAQEMRIYTAHHDDDAVAKLLRVRLSPAGIEPLEEVVLGVVVARPLQYLDADAAASYRELKGWRELYLPFGWHTLDVAICLQERKESTEEQVLIRAWALNCCEAICESNRDDLDRHVGLDV